MNPSAIQQLMFSLQDSICTFPQAHVTVFAVQQNNSEKTSCDGVSSEPVIGISLKTTKTETGVNSYSADKKQWDMHNKDNKDYVQFWITLSLIHQTWII